MTLAGMQRGTLETAKDTGERAAPELGEAPPRVTDAAVHERFNLHASVHVPAHDDLARERLCRYLARPAFSSARLGVLRDGLVVPPHVQCPANEALSYRHSGFSTTDWPAALIASRPPTTPES